ncbi:MAG: hypothetical protein BGO78_10945 [Chloroflexi bacterium 44-23]|nr:MAG: hypothetical protein BGO78_10945 [Chloroflexi bacterium 44-23]
MKRLFLCLMITLFLLTACQAVDFDAPAPVYETGIDSNAWATIPAGPFFEGQFNHNASIDYNYDMMITLVTNAQYVDYLNAALADGSIKLVDEQIVGFYEGDPFNNGRHEEEVPAGDYIYIPVDNRAALRYQFDGKQFTVKDTWENHPMTFVSWFGAKAYCEYYDGRLPTEQEWEKAARGTDIRPYAWGYELARNNANFITSRDPFENMSTFGSRTTPVGFYNGKSYDGYQTLDSASPFGLYDTAGNVWEWTSNIYEQEHYRYMRGGSKDLYEANLRVWMRNNARPTYISPAIGFRCAR